MFTGILRTVKEKFKETNIPGLCITVGFILVALTFIFDSVNFEKGVSLFHLANCGLMFAVFFYMTGRMLVKKERPDAIYILLVLILAISAIAITLNYLIKSEVGFSLGYYSSFIFFTATLVTFYIAFKATLTKLQIRIMLITVMTLGVFYVILYLMRGANGPLESNYMGRFLILGLANPNFTGMLLFMLFQYCIFSFLFFKNKWIKIASAIIAVVLFYFVYLTFCRNILVVLLGFLAFIPWIIFYKKNEPIKKWMYACMLLFPIVLVVIYMLLMGNKELLKALGLFYTSGKPIDTRQRVWMRGLIALQENTFFGSYFEFYAPGKPFFNPHNSLLYILSYYGAVPFILFAVYLFEMIKKITSRFMGKMSVVALFAFMAFLVTGLGEAAIFSGSQGLFIFLAGFLALAKSCSERKLWNERLVETD